MNVMFSLFDFQVLFPWIVSFDDQRGGIKSLNVLHYSYHHGAGGVLLCVSTPFTR